MEYRHEMKFMVSDAQLALVRNRLSPLMEKDLNQEGDYYTITSLYFDDINDTCLQDNLDGNDRRSKYRIRIYDNNPDFIRLEKKSKVHTMTKKDSTPIDRDECLEFMRGSVPQILQGHGEQKKKLFCEMRLKAMLPKSIVEYDRTAYVFGIGNVRITFDRNIRGTTDTGKFLDRRINTVPLLRTGVHILEVKYDELLPRFIYEAIEIDTLQITAFSKYCFSRQY